MIKVAVLNTRCSSEPICFVISLTVHLLICIAYGSKVSTRLNPEDGSVSPHSSSAHTSPTTRIRPRVRSADADNKKLVCFVLVFSFSVVANFFQTSASSFIRQYSLPWFCVIIRYLVDLANEGGASGKVGQNWNQDHLMDMRVYYCTPIMGAKHCNQHVCLSVCLFVCLSAGIYQKPCDQISGNSLYVTCDCGSVLLWQQLICYVILVLWMTSRFHIMEGIGQHQRWHMCFIKFGRWLHQSDVR